MSASHGRAISAGGLRPNAAALDSRALTRELGRANALPVLLSLEQTHGDRFDHFNLNAFWSKFKKLPRGELGGLRDRLAPVCEQTVRMLPELDARKVANIAHAFAKLVGSGPWESVWRALPEAALRSLGGFDAQGLTDTAWAFAKAGHTSTELFNAISAEVVRRRLEDFNRQHLSNTAWAFAKAGHLSTELSNVISAEVMRRELGDFNPQELSNTAWAFATAGHLSTELFKAISAEVVRRELNDFNPQHLSNTAWAFAKAGHLSTELFKAISAEVVRRGLGNFNEQDLSNTAWAFAVWNPPSADTLFGTTSFTTRCAHVETSFPRARLSQLHQWSLWREELGALWPGLPESLRQACRNAFVEEEGQTPQLQSDVVREIRSTGDIADVEEEYRCKVSGYSIDALVTLNHGERIAVEVDGPSHFVGSSYQPNGSTLLKHCQLRFFEWRLESVKYWEWEHSKELPWLPWRSR